jgi:hypothetical protein
MDVGSSMNLSSPLYWDLAHGTAVKSLAGTGSLLADYNISSHPLLDSQNSIKVQKKQKSGWHFVEHHTGVHFLPPWQPTPYRTFVNLLIHVCFKFKTLLVVCQDNLHVSAL